MKKTLLTIIVLGMLAVGTFLTGKLIGLVWTAPTVPTCSGEVMKMHDTCGRSYSVGGTPHSVSDYSSKLSSQQLSHTFAVYGIAFFAFLVIFLFSMTKVAFMQKLFASFEETKKDPAA